MSFITLTIIKLYTLILYIFFTLWHIKIYLIMFKLTIKIKTLILFEKLT